MSTPLSGTRIIWYEIVAFTSIITISWANELGGLARILFGGRYAPNWQDAAVETAITILVAIPTILISLRVSRRLHYLEGFLRVCAWCRKVGQGDDWISIEEFVHKNLRTQTSHGMCKECSEKLKAEQED